MWEKGEYNRGIESNLSTTEINTFWFTLQYYKIEGEGINESYSNGGENTNFSHPIPK
jgi:hypothetical protein